MPEIKVAHIVSFSSEDKNHPAQNLLKPEGTSKWRSGSAGEANVTCILQLEKAVKISQLDIGNEGSAFVEVLVGRSTSTEAEYQVILVASSFMNPKESREGQNLTRVRIFTMEKLNKAVLDQKWDRVKIVCSQPFNKSTKYGISFFKLHSPGDPSDPKPVAQTTLGAFKLKDDESSGSSALKAGSLFANRNKQDSTPSKPLTGAAAVRAASRDVQDAFKTTSPKHAAVAASSSHMDSEPPRTTMTKPRPPTQPAETKSREEPTEKNRDRPPLKRHSLSSSSVASERSSRQGSPPPVKKSRSEPTRESPARPFGRLMKKVIFVLSGYQNPDRGDIRDRALEMGATYRPDWGRDCTHLVCAFANTPKYNVVKRKGRIVTADWIKECHKRKKLLPWRKYRLGNAPSPPNSSGSDTEDEPEAPNKANRDKETTRNKNSLEPKRKNSAVASTSKDLDSDDPALYEGSTDEEEGDTDDEIQRIQAESTNNRPKPSAEKRPSKETPPLIELDDSTDDEDMMANLPELPNFFGGKGFLLYGDHSAKDRRMLLRFIIAYNGKLEDYMSDQVQYVVTRNTWDEKFDDALSDNPNLSFVKPEWILACNDKQKLVPHQKYVIIPQD